MKAILRDALREYRGQVIGWGLGMVILGAVTVPTYEMVAQNAESFARLVENLPRALTAFFGDMSEIINAKGFLTVKYYSFLPLMLGFFAIFSGTGMLSRDEENGVLDLVLAHPLHRRQVYFGRLIATTAATVLILLLSWIGLLIGALIYPIAIDSLDLLWPLVSLFAVITVFQRFALAVSQVLPSRRLAMFAAILFLFASFFITGLAFLNPSLDPIASFSPINYYQSTMDGLRLAPLAGLLVVSETLGLAGYLAFNRRDIRLSGEGGFDILRRLLRRRRGRA